MHDAPQDVLTEAYPEEEFWQDLLKVTGGLTDEALARLVIRESVALPRLDAPPRRALPALALGHAAPEPHQRLLHGRRQGAGQCLLPQREAWASRSATTRRSTALELRDGGRFVAARMRR
jgi:tricarballylate dehydrogenase